MAGHAVRGRTECVDRYHLAPGAMEAVDPLKAKIREILSVRLKFSEAAEKWGDDAALFGPDGLGLDSIDALELVLGLQKEFGVLIEDKETATRVLASIDTIAGYVRSQGKG